MARVGDLAPDEEQRLGRGETALWYGVATVSYVGVSIFEKGLLNWFVGPAWLVAVVWLGPWVTGRLRRRDRQDSR